MSNENCCKKNTDCQDCCGKNTSREENCCCKVCGDKSSCYYKQMYGVCRTDVPCFKGPREKPAKFVSVTKKTKKKEWTVEKTACI